MERLPRNLEKLLAWLNENADEHGEVDLRERFSSLDIAGVEAESVELSELCTAHMLTLSDERLEKTERTGGARSVRPGVWALELPAVTVTVSYPRRARLMSRGRTYRSTLRRERLWALAQTALAAVLGGFLAWAFTYVLPSK